MYHIILIALNYKYDVRMTYKIKETLYSGADPGFKVRGGALKKIVPSGGRLEIVGVFRVKNHDFTPKNHIFSNFMGARPPLDPPLILSEFLIIDTYV